MIPSELYDQKVKYFWNPKGILKAYSTGKVLGCALNDEGMPMSVRQYANRERHRFRDSVGGTKYRFADAAPGNLHKDYRNTVCVPFAHYISQDPTKALKGFQRTGDCVSWAVRTAVDLARCFEIGQGQSEEYRLRMATAGLYAERGHTGAGASTSRIARASSKIGILLEQQYMSQDGREWDFSEYDDYYKIGMKYGRTGLPDWITDITSQNAPRDVAEISSEEELLAALWNGNGVVVGSMLGVSQTGGKDGVPFLSGRRGSWAHAMAIVGFDTTKTHHSQNLYLWDNSWGLWNNIRGWPDEYGPKPEGAFVLTAEDTMWAVRSGECLAISDVEGFRPRRQKSLGAGGIV